MPILLEKAYERGWDRNNEHTADDPILIVNFRDKKTGRILFKYGATFRDLKFWISYFAELGEYERKKIQNRSEMAKVPGYDKKTSTEICTDQT